MKNLTRIEWLCVVVSIGFVVWIGWLFLDNSSLTVKPQEPKQTFLVRGWMIPFDPSKVTHSDHCINKGPVYIRGRKWPEGTVRLSRFYWKVDNEEGCALVVDGVPKGQPFPFRKVNIQAELDQMLN